MTDADRAELSRLRELETDDQLPIAGKAWNAIKNPDDNDWLHLPVEIRGKLSHLAEKALAGRAEKEGDYSPEGFFAKVREFSAPVDSMWVTPTRLHTEGWTDEQKAAFVDAIAVPDIPEDEARRQNTLEDGKTTDFVERSTSQRRVSDAPFDHPERRSVPERRQPHPSK
jgi:hypothetical protein